MAPNDTGHTDTRISQSGGHRVDVPVFVVVTIVWIILDRITKIHFDGTYELGQGVSEVCPLFRFRLVHNTGMAWGILGDLTFLLGIFSCVVCACILVAWLMWPYWVGRAPSSIETLGLSLVFAGGAGNAIDRFLQGYVVDFIELTFIDFPVFNVADIGITCGFVLVIAGYLHFERSASAAACPKSTTQADSKHDVQAFVDGNSERGVQTFQDGHSEHDVQAFSDEHHGFCAPDEARGKEQAERDKDKGEGSRE